MDLFHDDCGLLRCCHGAYVSFESLPNCLEVERVVEQGYESRAEYAELTPFDSDEAARHAELGDELGVFPVLAPFEV